MEDLKDSFKYIFFGTTSFSKELLLFLVENSLFPKAIFSIPQEFSISYSEKKVKNSNYANLKEIADKYRIDFYEIDSTDGMRIKDYEDVIKNYKIDLLLVLGWYYMIPKKIRNLSRNGAWGIHASLLPKYAGGSPLNWAIINGEEESGVTLFRMKNGVDDGDIIAQKSFFIDYKDMIKEVYAKAIKASKEILKDALSDINSAKFTMQDKNKIDIYPQRTPEDGEIDLSLNSIELYNFIRAQSEPYPGAYIKTSDGKKLIMERVRIENF